MRGGKRPGAGRPKGSSNAKTALERAAVREAVDALKSDGDTPLQVLLSIMRTTGDLTTKIDCAKAAAPYIHPRLANVEHSGQMTINRQEEALGEVEAALAHSEGGHGFPQ